MTDESATYPLWCVRIVGMNRVPHGVASEAVYGPFPSPNAADQWLTEHRECFGTLAQAPQVQPLYAPETPNG